MRNVTRQPSRAILSMTDARSSEQPKVIILPLPSQRKCHILHCLPVVRLFCWKPNSQSGIHTGSNPALPPICDLLRMKSA